jgi:hypothetical protein
MDDNKEIMLETTIKKLDKVFADLNAFDDFYANLAEKRTLTSTEKEIFTNIQTMITLGVQFAAYLALVKKGELYFDEEAEGMISTTNQFIEMMDSLGIQEHIQTETEREQIIGRTEQKKTFKESKQSIVEPPVKIHSKDVTDTIANTNSMVKGGFKGGFKGKKV